MSVIKLHMVSNILVTFNIKPLSIIYIKDLNNSKNLNDLNYSNYSNCSNHSSQEFELHDYV